MRIEFSGAATYISPGWYFKWLFWTLTHSSIVHDVVERLLEQQ